MAEYVVEFGKDGRPVEPDGRLDAPAFHRNHQAIRAVLEKFLAGKSGDVVEAGSGTGQHVVDFARHTPEITWWPSDLNEQHLKSIAAWRAHAGLPNIRPPLRIDLSDPAWCARDARRQRAWQIAGGVLRQCDPHRAVARCRRVCSRAPGDICGRTGGCFCTGRSSATASHTALSNAVFDTSLRESNPEWGVRDIADLREAGGERRPRADRNRRDARQQSDSGVRAAGSGLNRLAWRAPVCVG